jgi:tol-pal system protein YbgF
MNRRLYPVPLAIIAALTLYPLPAPAQENSVAANQEVRIQQLEGQIRDLNGQLEQMNYRVQQMSDRLDKLVADIDFRLRQMEGGGGPAATGEPGGAGPQMGVGEPPPEQQQQAMTQGNGGGVAGNQSATGAVPSGGTGQPRTLGTMPQSQYDTQKQQLNQNADAGAASAAAGQTGNTGTPSENDQTAAAAPYALQGSTPDEQYQYAFDLLRQTKYSDAERALSTFVDEYPDHPLAGNASYWLGETYYVRRDYNNAALTFAQAFQKYPKSGKAPDSLLKLGMSLAALGETADACKALHELSVRYPKAPDATKQRAAKEQAKNGCK